VPVLAKKFGKIINNKFFFDDVHPYAYITCFYKQNNTNLLFIQSIKYKKDTDSCTVVNCHHHNYQTHSSFAIAREEEHWKFFQQNVVQLHLKVDSMKASQWEGGRVITRAPISWDRIVPAHPYRGINNVNSPRKT
jgi:hypothetical protein